MFKKIFLPLGTIFGGSCYYFHKNKVEIDNPYLKSIMQSLHNYNPKFSQFLLKNMIQYKMLKSNNCLQKYVLSQGFDLDGNYLEGLTELGFNAVQVGPVSLLGSCEQQQRRHFGSKLPLANLNTFNENKQSKQSNTKVGLCIAPNFEVVKYTPYLMEQNMTECLKQFEYLNEIFEKLAINYYILKINSPYLMGLDTSEYLSVVRKLVEDSHKIIQSTFQTKKESLKNLSNDNQSHEATQKPQIYFQIPNKEQNSKIFEMAKNIPQLRHIIVDGMQFDISKDQKGATSKIVPGRKRITFKQFLERIVKGSL